MYFACIKLKGSIISTTPTFIGGVGGNTLKYIPGSFIRGAFGIYTMRKFCIKRKPWLNHKSCEAKDGCPYIELFRGSYKSSNIIFRYAYPEHVGCKNRGVYIPFRKSCLNGKTASETLFICSGCRQITRTPIKLAKINVDYFLPQRFPTDRKNVEFIAPGTRFSLEVILPPRMQPYINYIQNILAETLIKKGIGKWKSFGFGRFVAKIEVQMVKVEDVEKRAEDLDLSEFAVKLVSPTILGGRLLETSTLLEGARRAYTWVLHRGKPILPEIDLSGKSYTIEEYGGWSLKLGRPRRVEEAISAGSIFNFKCDSPEKTELALALAALEHYAIGKRKPHGCGQILIEEPNRIKGKQ